MSPNAQRMVETLRSQMSFNSENSRPWDVAVEYVPGVGWKYLLMRDGVLFGRYGNFETEEAAYREGYADLAKRVQS